MWLSLSRQLGNQLFALCWTYNQRDSLFNAISGHKLECSLSAIKKMKWRRESCQTWTRKLFQCHLDKQRNKHLETVGEWPRLDA